MSAPVPAFAAEGVLARPLERGVEPQRLALVRLHAFGDTVAVLPVLAALRARFSDTRLEVVTGPPSTTLFEAHLDVDAVHTLDARAPWYRRGPALVRLAATLGSSGVDAVLDLQRSRLSGALRRLVRPQAFAAFDRFAPRHGLDRYLDAAARLGLGDLEPLLVARVRSEAASRAAELLADRGHDPARPLVLLNPAGGWITKQWPLERYVELGRRLSSVVGAQPLLLGAGPRLSRVRALGDALGSDAVDLSGATTPDVAMAAVARAALAVSDDSGLMHLAWTQGVPTVAIFGASRSTWCRPVGERVEGFYSEDLSCGACMRPECGRGDLHCLDRVRVGDVLQRAMAVLREDREAGRT